MGGPLSRFPSFPIIPVALGIDPQPTRLGLALVNADTGRPLRAWVEPLNVPGGGWPYQQIATALRVVDPLQVEDFEVVAVGLEDPTHGAPSRGHAISHAHVYALVEAEVRRRWPHADVMPWLAMKGGANSTTATAPTAWKVWAEVNAPRSKVDVTERAQRLRFNLPTEHRQDAADAACIAWATYRWRDSGCPALGAAA